MAAISMTLSPCTQRNKLTYCVVAHHLILKKNVNPLCDRLMSLSHAHIMYTYTYIHAKLVHYF